MATKPDSRQIEHRSNLRRISDELKPTLKQILPQVDAELTPVFELRESATPDLVLNIGSGSVLNTDTGLTRSFSPISQQFFNYTNGTVTFPLLNGGNILIPNGVDSVLVMADNTYMTVVIQINSVGEVTGAQGVAQALKADTLISENFPIPNSSDLPIGYVTLQNIGGAVQAIVNENIIQFESGGGAGGGGSANELLERLKNRLDAGTFEYMSPVIFSTVKEELTATATAEYSLITSSYLFPLVGDNFVSVQMLDDEFLSSETELDQIELIHYWNLEAIDLLATYEVSRDGGNEYQTVTMDRIGQSDTLRGTHAFAEEAVNSYNQSVGGGFSGVLDLDNVNELSRLFSLTSTTTIKRLTANITVAGSPIGFVYAVAVKDDGFGAPSTDPLDKIGASPFISIDTLVTGNVDFNIRFTQAAGDYHIIFKTDDTYKNEHTTSSGLNKISIGQDGSNIIYDIKGLELDLRVKITSGTVEVVSEGFGIYYKDEEKIAPIDGSIFRDIKSFIGDVDNLNTFSINFQPDARLLVVYELGTGQAYRYGSFIIDGNNVIFEPNTFNKPETVDLEFLQIQGGGFDNSDTNRALLTANHLGSTDAILDLSVAGRGIYLRRPDGVLVELTIDNLNNVVII